MGAGSGALAAGPPGQPKAKQGQAGLCMHAMFQPESCSIRQRALLCALSLARARGPCGLSPPTPQGFWSGLGMILSIIIINNFGKPRMLKFYKHMVRTGLAPICTHRRPARPRTREPARALTRARRGHPAHSLSRASRRSWPSSSACSTLARRRRRRSSTWRSCLSTRARGSCTVSTRLSSSASRSTGRSRSSASSTSSRCSSRR